MERPQELGKSGCLRKKAGPLGYKERTELFVLLHVLCFECIVFPIKWQENLRYKDTYIHTGEREVIKHKVQAERKTAL